MRKYPPVGVIDRESVEDFTSILEEKEIPKKSKIEIPILYFHHNPNFYPEPDKWDPERFSRSGIAEREVRSGYASKKLTLLTFGAGPRSCIGMLFLNLLLFIVIITAIMEFSKIIIISNFRQQLCSDSNQADGLYSSQGL